MSLQSHDGKQPWFPQRHRKDKHSIFFFYWLRVSNYGLIVNLSTHVSPARDKHNFLTGHTWFTNVSQLHSVQGEANQMNYGKERKRLQWPNRPVLVVSSHFVFSLVYSKTQTHKHERWHVKLSTSHIHSLRVMCEISMRLPIQEPI